jgi:hypothetical protein
MAENVSGKPGKPGKPRGALISTTKKARRKRSGGRGGLEVSAVYARSGFLKIVLFNYPL